MATTKTLLLTTIFALAILLSSLTTVTTAIPEPELQSMLTALRSKGYNLFGNAIITSDIRYEVQSGPSFTFFAPTDGALFALDMTAPARLYVSTLRYHVVPGKLKIRELHSLASASASASTTTTLQTLLSGREVTIGGERSPGSDLVTVNGVAVVVPGLYYSKNVAVHGLNGILDYRSVIHASPPGMSFQNNLARSSPPRMSSQFDLTLLSPSPSTLSGTEGDVIGFLPESSDPAFFPPEFSMIPMTPVESPMTPVPSPTFEFSETPPSDLDLVDQSPRMDWGVDTSSDYGSTQSELQVTKKCKEGSNCGKIEHAWWMMREGGTPAMSPDFSWMKYEGTPAMTPQLSRSFDDGKVKVVVT